MKQIALIYFLLLTGPLLTAQHYYLQLTANGSKESATVDSINFKKKHNNLKSLQAELITSSKTFSDIGYINNSFAPLKKINDTTYSSTIQLKNQIKFAHIYIGRNKNLQMLLKVAHPDTIKLPYPEIEKFLSQTLSQAELEGYPLATVQLQSIKYKNNILIADLLFKKGTSRTVNQIVQISSTKKKEEILPKGHLRQLTKKYKNTIFNKNTISKINKEIEEYRFVNQVKYPEALLLQDSTKIYLYLEKRNSNTFDGYLGFNTDQNNKIKLNGYLNVALENTLKAGEQISLFWKSNGEEQKTFKTNIDIPYLFNSNIGLKGQINIFKQDSVFQNTKTTIDLGYLLNYNSRLYLGLQFTESTDIQQTNSTSLTNYKNSFFIPSYEYSSYNYDNMLFPKTTSIKIITGYGNRSSYVSSDQNENTKQIFIDLQASHNFTFNRKNHLYFHSQNFLLNSNNYLTNELYRFGGISTIRGFTENSLQARVMTSLLTEYRYLLSPTLYIHSIFDYSFYIDPSSQDSYTKQISGIGFGLGLQTQSGILKLSFANGSQKNQKSNLNSTIVSVNYNIIF